MSMRYPSHIVAAPDAPGAKCKVMFYLSANNNPEWQTIWLIREFVEGQSTEPDDVPTQTIVVSAPQKVKQIGSFEFALSPGCIYQIIRDKINPNDTALGDETILEPIRIFFETTV